MDIFEFELRYKSYVGLSRLCRLGRDEKALIQMTAVSGQGIPDRPIQEISPDEFKTLTKKTYTTYKSDFIINNHTHTDNFTQAEFYYPLGEYIERLEYELKVVKEMGFNTYMLVVSDFTTRAKNNTIMVGPGRGSGAGSLLAYLISITDVNPFAYDLLFERFLNPARISMPDFDIDFEDTLRSKVVQYVTEKYGHDNVCAIGTYMKLATKAAFKDAARAIGIPFEKSNQISNLMGEIGSLNDIIHKTDTVSDELFSLYQQDNYIQSAVQQGAQLEKNLRQLGVHACGVIISPDPVTHHTPTQIISKGGDITRVSQYDGPTLEHIGLVKMDFLGLRNLSVIKNCIKIIRAKYKHTDTVDETDQTMMYYAEDKVLFQEFMDTMSFNPDMTNTEVFEKVFMNGDTTGVFQFEGEGIRRFLIDLKPNHINDLVAMGALYRPGPLEFIPTYIRRKHGEEPVEYMLPELQSILLQTYKDKTIIASEQTKLEEDLGPIMNLTYGIAVYQEQLMFLVQKMAGFSLPEADLLRRGIGKKKKEVIEQLKEEFITRGASFRDYKPETTKFIYEKMIEPAASYSFNKSHAVCYAHIAYQTGYLKARYPIEFYAALLRSVEDDTDKLATFIDEVLAHNIKLIPPLINHAYTHIAAVDKTIVMGFFACKGIGYDIGEQIEQERTNNGIFVSLGDFLTRCPFVANKRILESLIKAGSFDERHDRNTLLLNLSTLLERHKTSASMDMGLFGDVMDAQELTLQQTSSTSIIERCQYDMEIFKNMISGHPFDGLYLYNKKFGFIDQYKKATEGIVFSVAVMIRKITRAKKKGFFILVEDVTDSFEFFVKELLDLKLYDVLLLSGFKSRNRGIDTMVKITIEEFVEQAQKANKYDLHRTVARVRSERNNNNTTSTSALPQISLQNTTNTSLIDTIESTIGKDISMDDHDLSDNRDTHLSETPKTKEPTGPIIIPLPNSIDMITKITSILHEHPGADHHIIIGAQEYHISSTGYKLLQSL